MMVRSNDPLTAAMTSFWAPLLRNHGFREYTSHSFGRVTNDCVFQYINLYQSVLHGEDFAVTYKSVLITRPQDLQELQEYRGLRCRSLMSHQGFWSAKTHDQANDSMREICDKTISIALPWFESTSTAL